MSTGKGILAVGKGIGTVGVWGSFAGICFSDIGSLGTATVLIVVFISTCIIWTYDQN